MKFSFFFWNRSDEEAANVELDEADDVKVESNPRQSLTNRLSSLYETILSKAAPNKKSERFAGVGNTAADVDVKVNFNFLTFFAINFWFIIH